MERDQPSPTHSDGELRDMVDPATQLDQGGNPLQEGIWANTDGGWQPSYRRDETFASMNSQSRALPQEPYLPWYHQATVKRFEGDGQAPITMTSSEWEEHRKHAFGPLLALGGRMLLAQALGGLMRGAVHGVGNFLQQAQPQPTDPTGAGAAPVNMVASVHEAVGIDAPYESPGSVPNMPVDHDPEHVDTQEFNDGDMSPAFNNPNKDDAGAGMARSVGEDAVNQKLEFRHDGDGVNTAELLLPKILEYLHSDKSALEDPQIRALHEQLDKEMPGYIDQADPNAEEVHKLLESLKHQSSHLGYSGEAMMPAAQNPQADFIQQAQRLIEYYRSIGDEQSARMYEQMIQQAQGHMQMAAKTAAPVYQTTPMAPGQMVMGPQQQTLPMPGTFQNPVQPGGMPVSGKCTNCGGVLNADGSCPQCGASAGANQQGNLEQPGHLQTPGIMPSPYAQRSAADHQGPITPEQQKVFADYLIQQGRNDEVAAMMQNPALYAEEWAQFINKSTQPPTVDPSEQPPAPPQPQMDPSQMGQMPVPGMSMPQPTASADTVGDKGNPRRCPTCHSATTTPMNSNGDMRCHRCGNIWQAEVMEDHPVVSRNWQITALRDQLQEATAPRQEPNPVATDAADATAPGDREQQQDSSLSWQSSDGTPLQIGGTYEMHNPGYAIPDIVKVQQVKPDSIVVTMEGQYNAPSDQQDPNDPAYTHEISLQEAQTEGLTFNSVDSGEGDQEQSQDNNAQDGIGQTVNTQPVEQPHGDFPLHAKVAEQAPHSETLPIDKCPKCDYGHVTSSYLNPETVQYECFRCANQWVVKDVDEDVTLDEDSRAWLNGGDDDSDPIGFDPRALAMSSVGQGRNIHDIAKKDPRLAEIRERLNKNAGAKFSPREQKKFIDEEGTARNADLLDLEGTHYVESGFDNSKARPDRVNDNYLGLGL